MSDANDKLERIREIVAPTDNELPKSDLISIHGGYWQYFSEWAIKNGRWTCRVCFQCGDTPRQIIHKNDCAIGKILEIINE